MFHFKKLVFKAFVFKSFFPLQTSFILFTENESKWQVVQFVKQKKSFFFLSKQPKYFICQWLFICQTLPKIFPTWQNRDRKLFFFSFFRPVILFHLSFSHLTIHSFYFYSLIQRIKVVLMRFLWCLFFIRFRTVFLKCTHIQVS